MKKYNKAIAGLVVPILALFVTYIAQEYGIKLDEGVAAAAATGFVGIITGAFVYAVPNVTDE